MLTTNLPIFPLFSTFSLQVNRLTAKRTQTPYDYYYLPFCAPSDIFHNDALKNIFTGEKPASSLYSV
jgi:hypothetical protein